MESERKTHGNLSKYRSSALKGPILTFFHSRYFHNIPNDRDGGNTKFCPVHPTDETRSALLHARLLVSRYQWSGNCSLPLRVMKNYHLQVMGGDGAVGKLRDFSQRGSLSQGWGCQVLAFSVSLHLFLSQVRHRCVFPNLLARISFVPTGTVKWVCLL